MKKPNCGEYHNYGARGIKCERPDLTAFAKDMLESYLKTSEMIGEENISIERIDVNKNYCKENCTWTSLALQGSNKRNTVYFKAIDPDGNITYEKDIMKFSLEHGLDYRLYHAVLSGKRNHHKHWKCERITKEEYESHNQINQGLACFSEHVVEIIHELYEKYKSHSDKQYIEGTRVNHLEVESLFQGYLDPIYIEEVCTFPNKFDLDITYDKERKCFFVDKL